MARSPTAVRAIVAKDLRLFSRDRFYLLVSVLGLVVYVGLFWLLPSGVDATFQVGVHFPGGEDLLAAELEGAPDQGLAVDVQPSAEALEASVRSGDSVAGLDFPPDFLTATAAGEATTVRLLLAQEAPAELRSALAGLVRESARQVAGDQPPVTVPELDEMVVGVDRADDPIPLREELRPLLVFLVLMLEIFALGSLVAVEIAQRTAAAVLVTPATATDLLAAKALLGTAMAFGQAFLLALVTGALSHSAGLVVVALLLGSVLVAGCGLLVGAVGQDFVAIVFWSMLFFVPLAIPAFAVLFPGAPAAWVRALPSYGLIQTLLRATAHQEGWAQLWPYLGMLAAWCAAVLATGTAVLGRRVARL